jgi:predicted hydrocarbon binding protein
MEETITKEILKKLMKIKGETRGSSIKGDLEYIVFREGKEGLKQFEEEMERIGYPIKYKEIEAMGFYKIGLEAITFLVMKKLFDFHEEDFVRMGEFNSKVSIILRLFIKYFASLDLLLKQAPKIWRDSYTVGDLKITEVNEEKRYVIVRLENFYHHPLHCFTVKGYMYSIIKMIKKGSVTCQETKCVHKGDKYHEFLLEW